MLSILWREEEGASICFYPVKSLLQNLFFFSVSSLSWPLLVLGSLWKSSWYFSVYSCCLLSTMWLEPYSPVSTVLKLVSYYLLAEGLLLCFMLLNLCISALSVAPVLLLCSVRIQPDYFLPLFLMLVVVPTLGGSPFMQFWSFWGDFQCPWCMLFSQCFVLLSPTFICALKLLVFTICLTSFGAL